MFAFFRKLFSSNPSPPSRPEQPEQSDAATSAPTDAKPTEFVRGSIDFSRGDRSWTETFDVVESMVRVLTQRGYFTTREGDAVRLDTSDLVVTPVMVSFQPLDDENGGSRTTTITTVRHAAFGDAHVFEFQHSTGASVTESIDAGFDQWAQIDLVVLLDALLDKPEHCTAMEMSFPATADTPARHRRVILGPTGHLAQHPPESTDEEHPFCPCCLLTRSIDAFKPLIEQDAFFAVRLFAMRDPNDEAAADCRVNGEDYELGKKGLINYVKTWPGFGMEFRKQYIVIQSRDVAKE